MLSCPSAASLASETNIIRCLGRFSNMTPIWAVTLSISTSGNWKELQRTTSAPNQRGATAPTKARFTTITVSDLTGPCDVALDIFSVRETLKTGESCMTIRAGVGIRRLRRTDRKYADALAGAPEMASLTCAPPVSQRRSLQASKWVLPWALRRWVGLGVPMRL